MLLRLVLGSACGLALALAFEPVALPWLVVPAVAGYALATRGLRARSAWLPGLAFGVAFYFTHIWWMRVVGVDAWLALAGVEAAFYALLGPVSAVLQRHRLWPLWLASAWVVMEAWRSGWPFSGMPWGRLAYAVADTPLAPALPYAGATGVSFVLALLGCLLAALVVGRGRQRLGPAVALGVALLACAVPTLAPWTPGEDRAVTVAAVQGDVPGDGDNILLDHRQVTTNHIQATMDLGRDVAAGESPAPDFVVWPENSTAVDPFRDPATTAGIEAAVDAVDVPVLVGAIVDAGEDHVLNQGIVWDPATGPGERYTKRHPVPYGEYIPFRHLFEGQFGRLALIPRDMLSGTRETPITVAGVEVADAICFDVAYDDGIYDQVSRGAELLVVQTSNATFIHTDQIDQQFAITRLRALETGRWVVVAATNGVSGVIAPDGEVVASAAPRTQQVLVESVGLDNAVTPAVRIGPWSTWTCVALVLVGLLLVLLPSRRWSRAERPEGAEPGPGPHDDTGHGPGADRPGAPVVEVGAGPEPARGQP